MKKNLLCAVILFLCIAFPCVVNADDNTVRIGLEKYFKGVSSITVNNNDLNVINSDKSYDVDTNGGYTVKTISKNYYCITDFYDTYNEAVDKVADFTGYSCIPALTDKGWNVYITTDKKPDIDVTSIKTGSNAVVFSNGGKNIFIADCSVPVQISSDSGVVDLGECKYRDNIEINVNGGTITAINVIDKEHYLYGVINSEMPASWSIEAQKAQAVAARTYIAATGNKHDIYDLCDNTNCQDYNGIAKESELGRQAVDETAGIEIYYDDEPISALYFSSDGGATQNSEDVWLSEVPYLRGITDEYEKECMEWTRTFTYSELTDICRAKGYNIGTVNKIVPEYNDKGICMSITFYGTNGSKTVSKEEVKTVFSVSNDGSLISRNFKIDGADSVEIPSVYIVGKDENTNILLNNIIAENSFGETIKIENSVVASAADGDKTIISAQQQNGNNDSITINGRGYGHGVGMSQYGAKAMAEAGFSYDEILKYYYSGIEVK